MQIACASALFLLGNDGVVCIVRRRRVVVSVFGHLLSAIVATTDATGPQHSVCPPDEVKMADADGWWNGFSTTWNSAATWIAAHFVDVEGKHRRRKLALMAELCTNRTCLSGAKLSRAVHAY